jgi:DNA replication protein DnaC
MDLALPDTITTTEAVCPICRTPFQARSMEALGIRKTVCDPCVIARRDADARDASEARLRAAAAKTGPGAWDATCPRAYRTIDEGGLTDPADLHRAQPLAARIAAHPFGPRGLILRGDSGTCKTRSMWRLLRRWFLEGRSIAALSSGEFERQAREAAGNHTLKTWFDRLAQCDALFIDDLGKSKWSDTTLPLFFDLIDHRIADTLPVLITTNYDRENLARKLAIEKDMAAPLLRRLAENCEAILLKPAPRG